MPKINDEQLNAVREIRGKQQQIQMELGALYVSAKDLAARQDSLTEELRLTGAEIQDIMKQLAEEHGHGTLDLETGEFTVQAQEATPELKVVK